MHSQSHTPEFQPHFAQNTPSARWLNAIIKCNYWHQRPKLSPVVLSTSLASDLSLIASRMGITLQTMLNDLRNIR